MKKILISLLLFFNLFAQSVIEEVRYETGKIVQVSTQQINDNGGGTILGGVIGGILGHQVGGGTGKKIATAVGAIGGAVVGNSVNSSRGRRILVRKQDGSEVSLLVNGENYRVGDRVRLYIRNGKVENVEVISY